MNLAFGVLQNTRPAEIKKFFLFISFTYFPCQEVSKSKSVVPRGRGRGEGGGGTLIQKGWGCLSCRLGGVNFGVWSHLGRSGQNTITFSREGFG